MNPLADAYSGLVLLPLLALTANIVLHAGLSRARPPGRPWRKLYISFLAGFFGLVLGLILIVPLGRWSTSDVVSWILLDLVVYVCGAYCYFHFVNINIASLRLRVLRELKQRPAGLAMSDLDAIYGARAIVDGRLRRLVSSDNLVEEGGRFYLGRRRFFLALFWVFEGLKRLFLGRGNRLIERRSS
jgi:uncharacterized membrane protein